MKTKWTLLIGCLVLPLAVGGVSALLSREGMQAFEMLVKPPLSPSSVLFPIVWTILYLAMGVASYLYLMKMPLSSGLPAGLTVYTLQLIFNFFWIIWFFRFAFFGFSFAWLLVLWGLIIANIILFYKASKAAGWLLVPYLAWVTFAGYLNVGIALLN